MHCYSGGLKSFFLEFFPSTLWMIQTDQLKNSTPCRELLALPERVIRKFIFSGVIINSRTHRRRTGTHLFGENELFHDVELNPECSENVISLFQSPVYPKCTENCRRKMTSEKFTRFILRCPRIFQSSNLPLARSALSNQPIATLGSAL